jgi:hypothetical protein
MILSDAEKRQIKEMIDSNESLPTTFLEKLFPHGGLDQPAFDRASAFNAGFKNLLGTEWTTIHLAPKTPMPPPHVQAAWPWRREIWMLYFVSRRSLGRAYCRYTTGEGANWSEPQRELERLCYLTNALTSHNGMEDRIAQLANCFNNPLQRENKIHFAPFFRAHAPASLPKTTAQVVKTFLNNDWIETHRRANTLKHHWTGEVVSHLPSPEQIRHDVDGVQSIYVFYGTTQINPGNVDDICKSAQRSLNLLVDLATMLDKEIGWPAYFHLPGESAE